MKSLITASHRQTSNLKPNHFSSCFHTRWLWIAISVMAISSVALAQHQLTSYAFSASAGTFTRISGTTSALTGGSLDDGYFNNIPIGFTFYYLDTSYTTLSACTNGWILLGRNITTATLTNNLYSEPQRPVIAPLWDDLQLPYTSAFKYKTTGSAPSRVFTAEWDSVYWYYGQYLPVVSFQVKLYEGSNKIEFIYYQEGYLPASPSASIGITALGTGSGNFISLDGTTGAPGFSLTTETTTLSSAPVNGQTYTFFPKPRPFNELEVNNDTTRANLIYYGDTAVATITLNDVDYYKFNASANDTVVIYSYDTPTSSLDGRIILYNRTGTMLANDDDFINTSYSRVAYAIPTSGIYFIRYAYYAGGGTFPNERPKDVGYGINSIVTYDTGSYRLTVFKGNLKPLVLDSLITAYPASPYSGSVNTLVAGNGLATTVTLQYGVTTSYGSSVSLSTILDGYQFAYYDFLTLTGLLPNTTYHYRVVASNAAATVNGSDHTFTTLPAPSITSFSPTSGPIGTSVTINGANFDSYPPYNIVYFGAVQATVTGASSTQLTVTVPTGATYAPISVTVNGAIAYSSFPFVVTFASSQTINSGSFASKFDFTTGSGPYNVAIGDVDGDGKPDLAVANNNSSTVSVFRNTSTSGSITAGSFAAKVDFTTGTNPYSVAIGDVDGDGKPDLAVTNYNSGTVSVFRNTSTSGSITASSFAAKVDFTTGPGTGPASVAIGDVDGDGKPDLVVANFSTNTVSVFRNTSTSGSITAGSFAAKVDFTTGTNPYSVAIGDVDGDGKPDLVVSNSGSNSLSVLRNTSTLGSITASSFAAKIDFTTGTYPYIVAIGDIDGDGKPDLVVVNYLGNTVSVIRNTSTSGSITASSFAAKVDFAISTPVSLALGDVDGDGKPDLAVANYNSGIVSVFRNTSTSGSITAGSFAAKVDFTTGTGPASVALGDVDGDGKPDIAVANYTGNSVSVLRNTVSLAANIGSAFFDGANDRIRVLDTSPINGSAVPSAYQISGTAITIEAWVFPMDIPAAGDTRIIIARPANTGIGVAPFQTFALMVLGDAPLSHQPRLGVAISDGVSAIGSGFETFVEDTATVKVGQWTHIAGTYDGAYVKLYINGVLARQLPLTALMGTGSTGLYIGGITYGYFKGMIDEVRLWSITRPQAQIQASMSTTLSGTEPGLAGYWPLDTTYITGGGAVAVADKSPNHNDLAVQFDARIFRFPQGSAVSIAPTHVFIGQGYAARNLNFRTPVRSDGWPNATITISNIASIPGPPTFDGDSLRWTPSVWGNFAFYSTATNASGTKTDTNTVFVENRKPTTNNLLTLDATNRGSLGADGFPGTGMLFNGKNGLYSGAFGVVDRTRNFISGGLYHEFEFTNLNDFVTTTSQLTGFDQAFTVTFADAYAQNPMGLTLRQTVHSKSTTPDNKYAIIEYTVKNTSGVPLSDIFLAQGNDFDIGAAGNNIWGYDSTLLMSYGYENTPVSNAGYYGYALLNKPASGHVFMNFTPNDGVTQLPTALTTFNSATGTPQDIRTMISSGPYALNVGDSITIAYAYVAGINLADLQTSVTNARTAYLSGAPPSISSFSPASGPIGTSVTINGFNFNAIAANNVVYFGAVRATVTAASSSQLTVTVPSGATYAPITVTVPSGGTAYSSARFVVTFASNRVINASSFAAKVDFSMGGQVRNLALGDVDRDGKPDLGSTVTIDANNYLYNISLFRNISSPGNFTVSSFESRVDLTAPNVFYANITFSDIDGDGNLDIVVPDFYDKVSVFRNISSTGSINSGSFAAKVDFATAGSPVASAAADLDGDGKTDLVVVGVNGNTISILRNISSPGVIAFAPPVDFPTGKRPWSVAIGDLDGDGKPDLAVVNGDTTTVSVFRNTSAVGAITAGSFAAKVDFTTGTTPYSVAIGDLDGDGKPDLAVVNGGSNTVSVFRNTASPGTIAASSFAAKVDFATGTSPWGVAVGDLDGDGKPDLAVANVGSSTVSVFKNTAISGAITASSFASKTDFTTGTGPINLAIGDLDGDGKPDLAVANYSSNTVSVLRNTVALPAPVTFNLDARPAMQWGRFNPQRDSLVLRGSVSPLQWFGVNHILTDGNNDSIYTITVPIEGLGNLEYKYVVKHNGFDFWEFQSGGGNRQYNVIAGSQTIATASFDSLPSYQSLAGEYGRDASTVGLWHLNEDTTTHRTWVLDGYVTYDQSGQGNHGYMHGTTMVDGRFGKARRFNGTSDYIKVLNSPSITLGSNDFTVEAWVRVNQLGIPQNIYDQRLNATPGTAAGHLLNIRSGGQPVFILSDINGVLYTAVSADSLFAGGWYHVAGVRKQDTIYVYLNGKLGGVAPLPTGLDIANSGPLVIGTRFDFFASRFLNGTLDEIRGSGIARSPAEFYLQLPPRNLAASTAGAYINLSWQNGGGTAPLLRYKIYRGTDSTNVSLLDSTLSTSYADPVSTSGQYFYRVTAVDVTGFESRRSYAASSVAVAARSVAEIEPNDVASQALAVSMGDTLNGTISTNTDVDYFKFQAVSGDTVEVFASPRGSSTLYGRISLIDSLYGGYYIDNNFMPSSSTLHSDFVAPYTGTYYLRFTYAYNYNSSYPNSPSPSSSRSQALDNGGGIPAPGTSVAAVATSDTGAYRIRLKRFVQSGPDVRDVGYILSRFSNSALLGGTVNPNGASTTVQFQYGTSTSYGSSVSATQSPVAALGNYDVTAPITGLLPNQLYHFRIVATNSGGTSTSDDNTFQTPPLSPDWTIQQSNSFEYFYGVHFSSAQTGTTVGSNGTILRTTNGGQTWTSQAAGNSNWLYGVWFVDQNTGFAVGDVGTILKTTTGGTSWTTQTNPYSDYLWRVQFFTPNKGIAVGGGGRIVRTTDGGTTWTSVRTGPFSLRGISLVDTSTGFVVGAGGTLLRTTNGGATWDSLSTGTTANLRGVKFFSASNGIVTGSQYTILRTTTGGTSWIAVANSGQYYNLDMAFTDANNGIIVESDGWILRTNNGGSSWAVQQSGTTNWLYGAAFVGNSATAIGEYGAILNHLDPLAETEPNNSAGQANSISYNGSFSGSIDPAGDVDYYSFTAAAGDTIEIFASNAPNSTLNGNVELLNSGQALIASNDDFRVGSTSESRVVFAISSGGTYYIRYSYAGTGANTGSYTIRLKRTTLMPQVSLSGSITNLTTSSVTLNSAIIPNNLSTTVSFQFGTTSSYGTTVFAAQSPVSSQQEQAVTANVSGLNRRTAYHFRVIATNSVGTVVGPDVVFNTPYGAAIAEIEPNDIASQANPIVIGDSVYASITTPADVDYFKFRASIGDTIDIFGSQRDSSALLSHIYVIDSLSGNYRVDNNYAPNSTSPHSVFTVNQSGSYYVRYTYAYNYSSSYPYSIGQKTTPAAVLGLMQQRGPTAIPSASYSATTVASNDTGQYRLWLRRFVPSTPDVRDYAYVQNVYSTSATPYSYVSPNSANATVTFEYGLTSSYGSTMSALENPITALTYESYASAPITGLTPNTVYHVRVVATNSVGQSVSQDNSFQTPPRSDDWTVQASNGTYSFYDVSFSSANTGTVVGGAGTIMRTTNGGATWTGQSSPYTDWIYGVWFTDANNGVIVTDGGRIARTTDGGTTWTTPSSPSSYYLWKVRFASSTVGVAIGGNGTIIRTTDGGVTWTLVSSGTTNDLYGIYFRDASNGYVVGYSGTLLKTTNGGASWTSVSTGTTSYLFGVRFADANNGIISGANGIIRRTTNGGASWTDMQSNVYNWLYGLWFKDVNNGVAVGDYGTITKTTDGGLTWAQVESGTRNTIWAVTVSGRAGYAVGENGMILNSRGALDELEPNNIASQANSVPIGESVNGSISPQGDVDYFKFKVAAGDTVEVQGDAVGNSSLQGFIQLFDSTTGSYYYGAAYTNSPTSQHLIYPYGAAGTKYIRYAYNPGSYPNSIGDGGGYKPFMPTVPSASMSSTVASFDTGAYRIRVKKFVPSQPDITYYNYPFSIFSNAVALMGIVGPNGLPTTVQFDYGTATSYGSSVAATQGATTGIFLNLYTAPVSGLSASTTYHYRVIATNSQGTTFGADNVFTTPAPPDGWTRQLSNTSNALHGAGFFNPSVGYTVGDNGTILRTINGGATWTSQTSNTTQSLLAIAVIDANTATAVGSGGMVLRTVNGGTTWATQNSQTTNPLYGVKFLNANSGLAVGGNGTIISTVNGGTNWSVLNSGTTNTLRNVVMIDGSNCVAVGDAGTIVKTTNGGSTWSIVQSGTGQLLFGSWYFNANVGIVVGTAGVIRRTTDGGTTWTNITSGTGQWLRSIWFSDANNGTIVGEFGTILKTTDAGVTWTSQASGTSNSLTTVSFAHPDTGTAVGFAGSIIRYVRATAAPNAPTLLSPLNAATGQPLSLTLQWRTTAGANSYRVQLSTVSSLASNILLDDSTVVDTFKVASSLSYNTTYYWRVRAKNSIGSSNYSTIFNFTTGAQPPPSAPTLLSPTNGATNQSPSLTVVWNRASSANTYRMQLASTSDLSGGFVVDDSTLTDTTKAVSGLSASTTFYWRVNAKNNGGTSAYSPTNSFTTASASGPSATTNPAANVTTSSAVVNATVNPNGNSTTVFFDWGTTTSYGNTTVARNIGNGTSAVSVSDTVRGLAVNAVYHFRIVATNQAGSVNGSDQTFVTVPPPAAPSNISAQVNATTRVTLFWSDNSTTEDGFRIQRRGLTGSFAQIKLVGANTTSYVDSGLTASTTYYYRLQAYNSAGNSAFTDSLQVVTILAPKAYLAKTKINYPSREAAFATYDTTIVLANNGAADLLVGGTTLGGPDAAHFTLVSGGGTYILSPQGTRSVIVRFSPTGTGNKTAYLQFATNDTSQGPPTSRGTVTDTLQGLGVDTTPPGSPILPTVNPTGWSNTNVYTLSWINPADASGIAALWYAYDVAPTTGSPGTRIAVTTTAAQIPPPTPGAHTLYLYFEDGAGNKNPSSAVSPTSQIQYDNVAPSISHDSTLVGTFSVNTPTAIGITAAASDANSGIATLVLQFRKAGTAWSTATPQPYTLFTGQTQSIPAAYMTTNASFGVDYRILATDNAGNSRVTPTHSITIQYTQAVTHTDASGNPVTQYNVSKLPSGTDAVMAYRMLSVPLDLTDKTPKDILETQTGLGTYDNTVWRFYKLNSAGTGFDEYPTFSTQSVVTYGKAFFLILASDKVVKVGPGKIVKAEDLNKAGIAINSGNNLVGNPFNFDIPVDSLSLANGDVILNNNKLWYFKGIGATGTGTNVGWSPNPTTIPAWEGVLLKSSSNTTLRFKIADRPGGRPPEPKVQASQAAQELNGQTVQPWSFRITATRRDNGLFDSENIFGVQAGATDLEDDIDLYEPPMVGQKGLGFYSQNGSEALTHDFRAPGAPGYVWDMKLRTGDRAAKVRLDMIDVNNIPDPSWSAFLIDLDQKMSHDLHEIKSLEVNSGSGLRNFRVVVGPEAFVKDNTDGVDLYPSTMMLFANYPNPFNPETIIRYTIPNAQPLYQVTLKLYNVIGQEVATLVNAEQKTGYYEIKFDGRSLSSGVYFYRITVNGGNKESSFTDIKKMMLIK